MGDWAREHGLVLRAGERAELPISLESLKSLEARVELSLTNGPSALPHYCVLPGAGGGE